MRLGMEHSDRWRSACGSGAGPNPGQRRARSRFAAHDSEAASRQQPPVVPPVPLVPLVPWLAAEPGVEPDVVELVPFAMDPVPMPLSDVALPVVPEAPQGRPVAELIPVDEEPDMPGFPLPGVDCAPLMLLFGAAGPGATAVPPKPVPVAEPVPPEPDMPPVVPEPDIPPAAPPPAAPPPADPPPPPPPPPAACAVTRSALLKRSVAAKRA